MAFFERVREKGAVVLYEEVEEGSTLLELIEANSARLGLMVAGPIYFERFDPERGITSYRELVMWNVRMIASFAGASQPPPENTPVLLAVLLPGLLALIAVSVATSLVGSFAVMRGWAIFGDALSHGAIAGLVAAYIVGFDFYIGALAAGLFVAFSVSYLERRTGLRGDVVIAVTFTSMLALAVLMLSRSGGAALKLEDVLFADVMASSDEGVLGTVVFSSAVTAFLFAFRKTLLAYVTDPLWSEAAGMRTTLVHYALLMLLSVTVITAFMTVGAIPAVASMIIPPAAALLLTSSPRSYLLASALIPAFSSLVGTALSVLFDTNVGSTVVLVYAAIFVATALTLRRP
jgi:iron/zinc/copper transport system permease protein